MIRLLLSRPYRLPVVASAVAAVVIAGAVAAGLVLTRSGDPGRVVTLSAAGCGRSWAAPSSGTTTFSVRNATITTVDVTLTSGGQKVYAEIPNLGPGVIRPIRVTLDPGLYMWRCVSVDGEITFSEAKRVTGPRVPDPSPAYIPVIADDLETAALAYRHSASQGLNVLATDTDVLARAVDAQNLGGAETDWLTAHLDYERLGAVYGAFGDFNDEINGRADGLVGGVSSPQFTGFLRLEYGLWHGQTWTALKTVADTLDQNVHRLVKAFPSQLVQVTDVPLRAHEILENALEFELTGDTDEGSHTNLATVRANIDGEQTVLGALRPLILSRDPSLLSTAERQLATLTGLVDGYRDPAGGWAPVQSLSLTQHEQLDAATDAVLTTLDQIPPQLEPASGDSS